MRRFRRGDTQVGERPPRLLGDGRGIEDAEVVGQVVLLGQRLPASAPVGVARHAKRHGVPVIAVVGSRADDLGAVYDEGIGLVLPTVTAPMTLAECVARVATSIPLAGESALRAFLLKGQVGTQPTHA